MTKTLRGFRFVIIVLGLLIFGSVVSARAGMPTRVDEAAQLSPEIPGSVWGDAADKSYTTSAVNSAADTIAPSFSSQPLTVTYTTSSNISMVDMDSDGDIDFLGYIYKGGMIFWWENDGNFVFSERIIATDPDTTLARPFDIDNDGDMDIVTYVDYPCPFPCINPDPDEIFWWVNDGTQSFTKSLISKVTLRSTSYGLEIVDLDQDGDGDLIYISSAGSLSWREFTDSGWVTHLIQSSSLSSFKGLEDIVTGDFDGDGDLDIVCPNDYDHPDYGNLYDALWLWENDGTTSFPTHIRLDDGDASYHGNRDMKAVDLDDDGDLDLLSATWQVSWWENQGDLQFDWQGFIDNSTYSLNPYDMDGDGDVDIYYRYGDLWVYLENLGTGDFQRRSIALLNSFNSIGDLDKDGKIDLVVYDSSASQPFTWLEYADVTPAALPFYDGFEDPYLGNSWENRLSERGVVNIQSETVITGTQSLYFAEPTAEIILHLDLSGEDQVDLSFLLANEDEPHGEDGLYISADGLDWHLVASRTITTTMEILQYEIDLDEAADLNGLVFNDHFQVKFTLNGGGFWMDEVEVYTPADRVSTIFLPMVVRLEENP
jgi:hypothetical protein